MRPRRDRRSAGASAEDVLRRARPTRRLERLVALTLVLLASASRAAADEQPPPDVDRPSRLRLLAPLAAPRNTIFYSGFGIPLQRQAGVSEAGTLDVSLRSSRTHAADGATLDGQANRVDALHLEHLRLGLTLALHDRIAVWTDAQVAGWDERRDRFDIHSRGTPEHTIEGEESKAVNGEATGRHDNLAVVTLGGLATLWRGADDVTAAGVSVLLKLPGFRRADITNSGTFDVAVTAHASLGLLDRVALHASAGIVVPFGRAWIFEHPSDFDARPFAQGALGVTWAVTDWLALGVGLDGAQSPWERELEFLDRPYVNASAGVRLRLGRFVVELGGGRGLTSGSADWLLWLDLGYTTEPLW